MIWSKPVLNPVLYVRLRAIMRPAPCARPYADDREGALALARLGAVRATRLSDTAGSIAAYRDALRDERANLTVELEASR